MKTITFVLLLSLTTASISENTKSDYIGQEHRHIKSLSQNDINAIKNGQGWGFAKVAELNGYPGPKHVLDLKDDPTLGLSQSQIERIQLIFDEMNKEARKLGEKFIAAEEQLNMSFVMNQVDQLEQLTLKAGQLRSELRLIHLEAHLKTHAMMSDEQTNAYNLLRGYSDNPCKTVPKGHNPQMWREHNGCLD